MSKTQLQTNNSKLSALIAELQGKATGGSGGSIETCTVTIIYTEGGAGGFWTPEGALTTVANDGSLQSTLVSEGDITKPGGTLTVYDVQSVISNVAVGTSVMFVDTMKTFSEPTLELQGAELISATYLTFYVKILGDATITVGI